MRPVSCVAGAKKGADRGRTQMTECRLEKSTFWPELSSRLVEGGATPVAVKEAVEMQMDERIRHLLLSSLEDALQDQDEFGVVSPDDNCDAMAILVRRDDGSFEWVLRHVQHDSEHDVLGAVACVDVTLDSDSLLIAGYLEYYKKKLREILSIPEGEEIPAEWQSDDPQHELMEAEEDAWEDYVEADLETWVDDAIAQMTEAEHHRSKSSN